MTPSDAALAVPLRGTYRLQLHAGFNFDHAAAIADYLAALGVSHAYCSPYLQAAPGSTHGYDVIAHDRPNEELGGVRGHARLVDVLRANRLGQVLDIVPNHMAIGTAGNEWWADVLENGPSSRYAGYFDVEWAPPEARLRNTVLIPVLGDHYGRLLDAGELIVQRDGARFQVCYADQQYPLDPRSVGSLIRAAAAWCSSETMAFVGDALAELPRPTATDRASVPRRHRDKAVLRQWLERVLTEEPALCPGARRGRHQSERGPRAVARHPRGAELPACVVAQRRTRPWISPLLRHQHADWLADGGPAGLRRHARAGARVGPCGRAGRAPHRPPGRSAGSGGVLPAPGRCRPGQMDRAGEDP